MERVLGSDRRSWVSEAESAKQAGHVLYEDAIDSGRNYPQGRSIKSVAEQVSLISKYYPGLDPRNVKPVSTDCTKADGILVVPNISKFGQTYHESLEHILRVLRGVRHDFMNTREGELGLDYLRLTERTKMFISRLNSHDFLTFPVQMGRVFVGKSARRAHTELEDNEFGLSPFEAACFLVSHPEWLTEENDLGIDCIGCEYGPYMHHFYKYILFFYFNRVLKFEERWCGCPDVRFGPATGYFQ